ncbi:MAG: DUF533 domain-containing protein [Planctomycetaceae bacterium]|nr:DUF533 domain-containing protein [Planctomycetaceae bacterium]
MDIQKLLQTLTGNPASGAAMGGLAGSVLGNVLTGRGGGKKMLKYGGLAAIGYVAYQAWQKSQAAKTAGPGQPAATAAWTPPPARAAIPASFDLEAGANASNALRVVQAMVAASKADGVVDASERDRVFEKLREADLSQADQDEVLRLLTQPMDMEGVVRGVDSRELALEIYAASVFVVAPTSRAERAYLDLLAARLGLDANLTQQVEQGVEAMARQSP